MKKTSFLALLEKNFPEKLSGLSVKGGGEPPLSAKEKKPSFSQTDFLLRGGGGTPLTDEFR